MATHLIAALDEDDATIWTILHIFLCLSAAFDLRLQHMDNRIFSIMFNTF